MDVFNDVFSNLIFYKVKTDEYSVYMARIYSQENYFKYVVLVVHNKDAKLNTARIGDLNWVSLQTRSITDNYDIPEQNIDYKKLDQRYAYDKIRIIVKDRNEERTSYTSSIPIELILLHNIRKKSVQQYADTMDIRQALATFQCVVKRLF